MRKVTIGGAIVLTLSAMSWGAVYASASTLLKFYPGDGAVIATARPRISVNWVRVPGVKIKDAKLTMDGRAIDLTPPAAGAGFTFRPETKLTEGPHRIRVEATYSVGAARKIAASWRFTVDTEPPPLSLENGESFYVSPARAATVPLKSEPGANIEITFNGEPVNAGRFDRDGRFEVQIGDLKDKNSLRLTVADAIGNQRALGLPVILDETTPAIDSMTPGEDEVVRQPSAKLEVGFTEKESGLRSMTLSLDGTAAATANNDGTKRIVYLGPLLTEGPHTAKVEAVDYGGHKVSKEWRFTVDTRRIVVSRSTRRLYFYRNGALQRTYRVAVGMAGYGTPGGRWRIVNKQTNPSWINPGSAWAKDMPKVIPPSWSNPLGVRALALNAPNILIHGTSEYASIGQAASHGCIRMRNADIVNFFPAVGVGVPVDIL